MSEQTCASIEPQRGGTVIVIRTIRIRFCDRATRKWGRLAKRRIAIRQRPLGGRCSVTAGHRADQAKCGADGAAPSKASRRAASIRHAVTPLSLPSSSWGTHLSSKLRLRRGYRHEWRLTPPTAIPTVDLWQPIGLDHRNNRHLSPMNSNRRSFFKSVGAVAAASVAANATTQKLLAGPTLPPDGRFFKTSRSILEIENDPVGELDSVEGGYPFGTVIAEAPTPDGVIPKHLGEIQFADLVATAG